MSPEQQMSDPRMNPEDLYREEVYTDRKVGTIRSMTPVKLDGTTDDSRPVLYVGQAQLMTHVGAVPLTFEIEATTLEEAVEKFSAAAQVAVEQTVQELQELRREAASSIVLPEAGGGGIGGMPGGGKIQMP